MLRTLLHADRCLQIHMGHGNDLLHAVPPPARPHKIEAVARMDRRPALGIDHAAGRGNHGGPEQEQVRTPETGHGHRVCRGRSLSTAPWLDG